MLRWDMNNRNFQEINKNILKYLRENVKSLDEFIIVKDSQYKDFHLMSCNELFSIFNSLKKEGLIKNFYRTGDGFEVELSIEHLINIKERKKTEELYYISDDLLALNSEIDDNTPRKCLVIMPIGKKDTLEYKNNLLVFNKIIKPCVVNSGFNFNCYHADLIDESGNISRQIFEGLKNDDLVIADLRRNNTNMVYELGVRHAFGKRTILICSNFSENFFHSGTYRGIQYNINGGSNLEFAEKLRKQIKSAMENPIQSDNPVIDMLGRGHLAEFVNNSKVLPALSFNQDLNVYVDSVGGRFCTGCYVDKEKAVPVTKKTNYIYSCPVCNNEYVDSIEKDKYASNIKRINSRKSGRPY